MRYQEFVYAVEKKMNQKLDGGVKAKQYTAIKNNGRKKTGIVMESPESNVAPTIYLEEFYQRFLDGETIDELVQDILDFYGLIKYEKPWNTDGIERYDAIRDKIVFKVIHTEKNRELLKGIPHMEFLDLSIVFYALVDVNDQGTATMTVCNEHLRCWNVTKEELLVSAQKNVKSLLPAELITMRQVIDEMRHSAHGKKENLLEGPLETVETESDFMYVLSNPIRSFGAACIAYPEVLDMAGQILGEDYYVLPSSVHEVILVPQSKGREPDEMSAMVAEINEMHVEEEEILSSHAYLYQREERRLVEFGK